MEGDIKGFRKKVIVYQISIHALRVEGDEADLLGHLLGDISIHALRVEGDNHRLADLEDIERFLSTPSGWRATTVTIRYPQLGVEAFLSTPSGWRATVDMPEMIPAIGISIHALRVEGDFTALVRCSLFTNFYPRPPGGGRQTPSQMPFSSEKFLSTPSGWRATYSLYRHC